jgi:hypothetical protein
MSTEDLSNRMAEGKESAMIIDLLLTSVSKTQAVFGYILALQAGEDEDKKERLITLIEQVANEQRKNLIEDLYKVYGWLPPDILGESDQER